MSPRPLNLFDLIYSYDESVGKLVKSFGCVDYNKCIQEMDECFEMCVTDRHWIRRPLVIKFKASVFFDVHKFWDW